MTTKKRLNKTIIEGLEAIDGKQVVYWDEMLSGLGVRVSPGGTKTFFIQSRVKGKTVKVTIGKFGTKTIQQARTDAIKLLGQMADGINPNENKRRNKKKSIKFGELLDAYVDYLEFKGKNSANEVEKALHRNVKLAYPALWKRPTDEIRPEDVMKIIRGIIGEGKRRQADKVRSYIRTAFNTAINSRTDPNMPDIYDGVKISLNPASAIRKIEGSSEAKDRALSLNEFRTYWEHIQKLPEPKRSLATLHVLTGGQRIRQLARITLDDINRDDPSFTIRDIKGKRAQPRLHVVPLLPEALKAIQRITGAGDYVFSCDGGLTSIGFDYLSEVTREICSKMKKDETLEGSRFTASTIRATIETRLLKEPYSVPEHTVAHLLSHGMGTVQRKNYQHDSFFEEKLRALEKLQRMLTEQPKVVKLREQA